MTTHKSLPVAGYRDQADDKVQIVNGYKQDEERLLRKLDRMAELEGFDQRWLAIGRAKLEEAFMAINRSVFQPARVKLPEDQDNG